MAAPNVLIIDSSLSVRVNLQHALMAAGFKVTACESGAAGRKALRGNAFDLIVVEAELPDIDGLAIVQESRINPKTVKVPVILTSSQGDVQPRLRALSAGANDYIGKPVGGAYIVKRARQLTDVPIPSSRPGAFRAHNPLRVLIVDDSETFLNAFADRIRAEGHDVVLAKSGAEALSFLDAQPVDAIVLDLFMPGLSGLETCRRIRNAPASTNVPIMLLTGREDSIARATGISAGVDDYMVKSTDLTAMASRLGDLVRKKPADRPAARPSSRGPDSPRSPARLGALLSMAASAASAASAANAASPTSGAIPAAPASSPGVIPAPESGPGLDRGSLEAQERSSMSTPPPPPSRPDSTREPDSARSAPGMAPLFDQVLLVSGLQNLIGRGCLRRAFDRAGVDPRTLTADGLSRAMPEIKQTLNVFLPREEAERHAQAISALLPKAPASAASASPSRSAG